MLLPTDGQVKIGNFTLSKENKRQDLKKLRERAGIVFQYPEHQLFEETVKQDISFGPTNFRVSSDEIEKRVKEVMKMVQLPQHLLEKSPFELSGGQMRRVAIAGVLAMYPEVLILDEPTAGLDPRGQRDIMQMFYKLHQEKQLTTVLVTHQMDHALQYADRLVVLADGKIYIEGSPEEIFSKRKQLMDVHLDLPEILQVIEALNDRFTLNLTYHRQSISELAEEIAAQLEERNL